MLQLLKAKAYELKKLADFYAVCGYGGTFNSDDTVFYILQDNKLCAVVRIASEQGIPVLRGMQVLPHLRGQHIGKKLLKYMMSKLSPNQLPCYCLPHSHLINFYGEAGFVIAEPSNTPEFLIKRKQSYLQQGLKIELMVKS